MTKAFVIAFQLGLSQRDDGWRDPVATCSLLSPGRDQLHDPAYEAYTGPLPDSDEYQAEAARYSALQL